MLIVKTSTSASALSAPNYVFTQVVVPQDQSPQVESVKVCVVGVNKNFRVYGGVRIFVAVQVGKVTVKSTPNESPGLFFAAVTSAASTVTANTAGEGTAVTKTLSKASFVSIIGPASVSTLLILVYIFTGA